MDVWVGMGMSEWIVGLIRQGGETEAVSDSPRQTALFGDGVGTAKKKNNTLFMLLYYTHFMFEANEINYGTLYLQMIYGKDIHP